jgi:hypothetical protein
MSRTIKNRTWWAKTPHQPQRRPENAKNQPDVCLVKNKIIFGQELLKIMKEHPVENGAFRMTGTIDSGHSRKS